MTDIPTQWLLQKINMHSSSTSLWLSDENVLGQLPDAENWLTKPVFLTNRWDIAQVAKHLGFNATFNDFDLTTVADNSIDNVFYRISKEKAVVHHLINQAQRVLKPGGILWLSGQKNEGIKTYIEKACDLFVCTKNIQKDGMCYSSELQKNISTGAALNDEDYQTLRECFQINGSPVLSKPGQFGWNKIDQGSDFLIGEIRELIQAQHTPYEHCLDLGCGYGYLTIASREFPVKKRTLTDNNAAALITANANCARLNITAEVIASDAGKQLQNSFDLILCNPPFHQGFSVDGDLTDKFLHSAQTLLSENGVAYFVVNQFIALEKKARVFFKQVNLIARNKSFCLFELRKN